LIEVHQLQTGLCESIKVRHLQNCILDRRLKYELSKFYQIMFWHLDSIGGLNLKKYDP
jgi:hypothetical protein